MPEIAEAQALLAALAQTDEVKAEAAQRQRLTQLQVAYGNALIAARGFGAPETTEAFAQSPPVGVRRKGRARAAGGRFRPMGRQLHAGRVAVDEGARGSLSRRHRGATRFARGRRRASRARASPTGSRENIVEARDHLERALALFQPGRDDDLAFRFGPDPGVAAMAYLAIRVMASRRGRSRGFAHRAR